MTIPAAETKSIGLLANAPLAAFLHRYLDIFYRDVTTSCHLPGLCKNACQPWHRRQLPIPPGRYV